VDGLSDANFQRQLGALILLQTAGSLIKFGSKIVTSWRWKLASR